jgi:hypothetical protein
MQMVKASIIFFVQQQPEPITIAASCLTHSFLSVLNALIKASSVSGHQLQSTFARHRTAALRACDSSVSPAMIAQAPCAEALDFFMSAGGIGGQHGLIQPPVARLKGSIMLLIIFPRQHLQNFALSFFTCSAPGRSFV